jgi:hypothetical protein
VVDSCEYCNEHSGSIEDGDSLGTLQIWLHIAQDGGVTHCPAAAITIYRS